MHLIYCDEYCWLIVFVFPKKTAPQAKASTQNCVVRQVQSQQVLAQVRRDARLRFPQRPIQPVVQHQLHYSHLVPPDAANAGQTQFVRRSTITATVSPGHHPVPFQPEQHPRRTQPSDRQAVRRPEERCPQLNVQTLQRWIPLSRSQPQRSATTALHLFPGYDRERAGRQQVAHVQPPEHSDEPRGSGEPGQRSHGGVHQSRVWT